MIEKLVESRITAALRELALDGMQVIGAWESSAAGTLRNAEDAPSVAVCAVALGVRSYGDYTLPAAEIPGAVVLTVRTDMDPTGEKLDEYASAVAALLDAWHAEVCCAYGEGPLDIEGFEAAGFSMTGGDAPATDRDAATVTVSFNFTISGRVTNNQN